MCSDSRSTSVGAGSISQGERMVTRVCEQETSTRRPETEDSAHQRGLPSFADERCPDCEPHATIACGMGGVAAGRREPLRALDGVGGVGAAATYCGSRPGGLHGRGVGKALGIAMCILVGSLGTAGAFVGVGLPGALRAVHPASSALRGRAAFVATGGWMCPFGLGAKPASSLCAARNSGHLHMARIPRRSPSIMGIQSVFLSDERRVTSDDGDFNIPPEGMSNQERSLIRVLRERMRRRERVSGHVAPDTEKGMSLQERSIIRVLRERMRRRERVSGHAAPDTDQRATMEKERLKEKLALRNGMRSSTKGVLNVSKTTRDVSEAKALAGRAAARSSSPKRSASPTRRVEVAVRETQARKSALAATPVEVPAPKAAAVTGAAPLPTSTPEQAKSVAPDVTCESCAAGSYTAWLPRKISAYCKLSEVVDALELVQGTEVASSLQPKP